MNVPTVCRKWMTNRGHALDCKFTCVLLQSYEKPLLDQEVKQNPGQQHVMLPQATRTDY